MLPVLLLPSLSFAAVTSNCATFQPNIEFYQVKGDTSDQVKETLGKACGSGTCYDGYASYSADIPTCSGGTYDFQMTNKVTMPSRLTSATSRNPTLITNYNMFYDNLLAHEMKHIANGREACNYIVRELSKDPGCTFTAEKITDIMSDGWQRSNQADKDLDSSTNHGMTEGACFGSACSSQCVGCKDRYLAGNTAPTETTVSSIITSSSSTTSGGTATATITYSPTTATTVTATCSSATSSGDSGSCTISTNVPTNPINSNGAETISSSTSIALFMGLISAFFQ